MIRCIAHLQKSKHLSQKESAHLLELTESLVDNPENYKDFLTQAKSYRMVAGGRLAAYMMLIAGWAAKIVTANHVGDAWIRLAHEKLDYLATTERCADSSKRWVFT